METVTYTWMVRGKRVKRERGGCRGKKTCDGYASRSLTIQQYVVHSLVPRISSLPIFSLRSHPPDTPFIAHSLLYACYFHGSSLDSLLFEWSLTRSRIWVDYSALGSQLWMDRRRRRRRRTGEGLKGLDIMHIIPLTINRRVIRSVPSYSINPLSL